MVSIRNLIHFITPFHPPAPPAEAKETQTAHVPEVFKGDSIKVRIQAVWHRFLVALRPTLKAAEIIQSAIDKVDRAEREKEPKPVVISLLRQAFEAAIEAMQKAKVNPAKPPKRIAQQLVEILGRFGIAIYSNHDVKHPFQSAFDILRTAILVQQYALGLSKTCPDLTQAAIVDDLYNNETLTRANLPLADAAIETMDRAVWAAKAVALSQKEQTRLALILRYANGATNYLKIKELPRSERLLHTAEDCLQNCRVNPAFDKQEADHQMAELIYNELTGLYAWKAELLEAEGKSEEAQKLKSALSQLWGQCIALSADPEKMRARCDNKRTFIEKLTLEQEFELRISSLNGHLALPEERQDKVLIALSLNNLSHLFERMDLPKDALKFAILAMQLAIECRQKGENDSQFDSIEKHVKHLLETYAWVFDAPSIADDDMPAPDMA